MNHLKTIVQLQFEAGTRPWLELGEILRLAAADQSAEVNVSPLVVDKPKEKRRVVLQVRGVALEQEATGAAPPLTLTEAVQFLSSFNKATPLPTITHMRHDVVLIEPFSLPFHELVKVMKDRYLKPSETTVSSTDISLIWDQQSEKILRHIQIGPMDKTQLQGQFLRWPASEKLPEVFAFMNMAYQQAGPSEFSKDSFEGFWAAATDWQVSRAQGIIAELNEVTHGRANG